MRLPLIAPLESRDGSSNKDSRMTNALAESEEGGSVAVVRPGLTRVAQSTGNGNGLVAFNDQLIAITGSSIGWLEQSSSTIDLDWGDGSVDALSEDGSVIVGYKHSGSDSFATRWTAAGGTVFIDTGGGRDSSADAVSDDGSVVAGSIEAVGEDHAFRWTQAGGLIDLGAGSISYMSSDGDVLTGTHLVVTGFGTIIQAFRWTQAGGIVDIGTLGKTSNPTGISSDGSVIVGYSALVNNNSNAFRWTQALGMLSLGTLGGTTSSAKDLSSDGSVVVGRAKTTSDAAEYAFRWTQAGGMVSLGTLGGTNSYANAVSSDGSVVIGLAYMLSGIYRAFRWTSATGMVDIGAGDYSEAMSCSSDGNTIVGQVYNEDDDNMRFFSWTLNGGFVDLGAAPDDAAFHLSADGRVAAGLVAESPTVFNLLSNHVESITTLVDEPFDFAQSVL
jgi:probable HAF family extracellular repeat protein